MSEYQENGFLLRLLNLQQDGSGAISAPSNWSEPPLLEIETELDILVESMSPRLLSNHGSRKTGLWWFLVGSPGNGKSALVGKLVRKLQSEDHAEFRTEKDNSGNLGLLLSQIDKATIPYKIEMYEEALKYSSTWLTQDASVVSNPYSEIADPAHELIQLLKDAADKGVSLVICANRGVLEKAYEISERTHENTGKPWFVALNAARENASKDEIKVNDGSKKTVFNAVDVTVSSLDDRSLLAGETFDRLVAKAVASDNWSICEDCLASKCCPFKLNKDWLSTNVELFRQKLRVIELYSGQIIVFREMIALLSFVLAGCTRDYETLSACRWVEHKQKSNHYFALLSRRIYLSLFSSYTNVALESNDQDYRAQLSSITDLLSTSALNAETLKAIDNLHDPASTDVGLARLLSADGGFAELDPIKELQGKELEQRWDVEPTSLCETDNEFITELEKKCFLIWHDLEVALDNYGDKAVPTYRWLRRWFTQVTYRLGFFSEGKLLFEDEVKKYDSILDNNEDSREQSIHLREVADSLTQMLAISKEGIEIGPFVSISGNWVIANLFAEIDEDTEKMDSISVHVGKTKFEMSAKVYAWLTRKIDSGLVREAFPEDVLKIAEDIRQTAATESGYAFAERDIELKIVKPGNNQEVTLRRLKNHLQLIDGGANA
jgi:hypothetical protein